MKIISKLMLASASVLMPITAAASDDVMVVYDASGSMWGQIDGVTKIEIARDVLAELVDNWDDNINLGLVAYGHRREGDCSDIETLVSPAPISRGRFLETVNGINPKGRTPLSAAVQHAAEALAYRENPATVILISDGVENCQADPCALSAQLAGQGINFTAHVIGFDVATDEHEHLACIADNTGGVFVPAENAEELREALAHVQSVVDLQPVSPPEPEAEPEPEPLPEITVTAPQSVVAGSMFDVSWSEALHDRDYVTIVPAGAREIEYTSYVYVRDDIEGVLTAQTEPGLYEVRYVTADGRQVLGSTPVEIVPADIEIRGPETAVVGSRFTVQWTRSINPRDYVTIVPVGADEGRYGSYAYVREDSEATLTAPADAGVYELRYVSAVNDRTLASAPIEVTAAAITVSGPETVTTGESFTVEWDRTIDAQDIITIIPAGADEGARGNWQRVRQAGSGELTAPAEPGLYELRYMLNEGRGTLGSAPIEVLGAAVTVSGPETVTTGESFRVEWDRTIDAQDMITIVPAGADEGARGNWQRVRQAGSGELTAPAEPGLYELRYMLNEGRGTLGSVPIEVLGAEVSIVGPGGAVRAGNDIDIHWTRTINSSDRIAIVPLGSDASELGHWRRAGDTTQTRMSAPDGVGLYEVRYVLEEGRLVLASDTFEVVPVDAPLDDGAGLSVPDVVSPGERFTVTWQAEIEGARVALARADQADFTWIEVQPANAEGAVQFTAPDQAGNYEVRFLDISNQAVLGRAIVVVE